jgi:hypothetical protein
MSLLSELNAIMDDLNMSVETGAFSGVPPDEYAVLTPLIDDFSLFADNTPQLETQEVRISLFSKSNYRQRVRQLASALLAAGVTITERKYAGFETETGYHNYAVDTAKFYNIEEGN